MVKPTAPPPRTRYTPRLVTPSARSRCQLGRSPNVKYEIATARTGKVLLRSVACPAGMSDSA
jgi:hypothetical protein